jgi:hypothetical protein
MARIPGGLRSWEFGICLRCGRLLPPGGKK